MRSAIQRWFCAALVALGAVVRLHAAEAKPVYVVFWFDTEDYLLPADDDATKRLCEMFTARNVHAGSSSAGNVVAAIWISSQAVTA